MRSWLERFFIARVVFQWEGHRCVCSNDPFGGQIPKRTCFKSSEKIQRYLKISPLEEILRITFFVLELFVYELSSLWLKTYESGFNDRMDLSKSGCINAEILEKGLSCEQRAPARSALPRLMSTSRFLIEYGSFPEIPPSLVQCFSHVKHPLCYPSILFTNATFILFSYRLSADDGTQFVLIKNRALCPYVYAQYFSHVAHWLLSSFNSIRNKYIFCILV